MPRLRYVETSVVNYLSARPSRDLIVAAHQEVTRQWWSAAVGRTQLVISQFVVDDAALGNTAARDPHARLRGLKHQNFVRQLNCGEIDMNQKAIVDLIIRDLHKIRRELATQCGNDLSAIVRRTIGQQVPISATKMTKQSISQRHGGVPELPFSKQMRECRISFNQLS